MFKKTVAIIAMALLAIPAVGQAASKKSQGWNPGDALCVPIPISTSAKDVHVGTTHVHVAGRNEAKVCVISDSKLNGTPTVTPYNNCGTGCFAVRVADINVSADLKVELTYKEDGEPKSISYDPDPIDLGRDLEEICVSNHDAGTPDPCVITLTSPNSLKAKGGPGEVSLRWSPGGEAYEREVQATYEIWRGTGSELDTFEKIAEGVAETRFLDSGLARKTTYSYFVVAVDAEGNRSGGSNMASATTT